ncbi:hypothetical protein ACFL1G_11135 [Planctomycetota bacterium]
MKRIMTILCTVLLFGTMAHAKPMTSSVESWEGIFSLQQGPVAIHAEGKPKLFLWLYQLDQGSKGTCIGFSRENDGMILAAKPNEKGVQPIYTGYYVLFGEDDTVELVLTYDVQGNGGQKVVEKYTYDGKQVRLTSQSEFFGKHEPIWKKFAGEPTEPRLEMTEEIRKIAWKAYIEAAGFSIDAMEHPIVVSEFTLFQDVQGLGKKGDKIHEVRFAIFYLTKGLILVNEKTKESLVVFPKKKTPPNKRIQTV